jgi:hypothetical protein
MKLQKLASGDDHAFTIFAALECGGKTVEEYVQQNEEPQSASTCTAFVPVVKGQAIEVMWHFEGTFSHLQTDLVIDGIYAHSIYNFVEVMRPGKTIRSHRFDSGITRHGFDPSSMSFRHAGHRYLTVNSRATETLKEVSYASGGALGTIDLVFFDGLNRKEEEGNKAPWSLFSLEPKPVLNDCDILLPTLKIEATGGVKAGYSHLTKHRASRLRPPRYCGTMRFIYNTKGRHLRTIYDLSQVNSSSMISSQSSLFIHTIHTIHTPSCCPDRTLLKATVSLQVMIIRFLIMSTEAILSRSDLIFSPQPDLAKVKFSKGSQSRAETNRSQPTKRKRVVQSSINQDFLAIRTDINHVNVENNARLSLKADPESIVVAEEGNLASTEDTNASDNYFAGNIHELHSLEDTASLKLSPLRATLTTPSPLVLTTMPSNHPKAQLSISEVDSTTKKVKSMAEILSKRNEMLEKVNQQKKIRIEKENLAREAKKRVQSKVEALEAELAEEQRLTHLAQEQLAEYEEVEMSFQ